MHGTIMVFFVLTTATGGFGKLLPGRSDWRPDMAISSGEYVVVLDDVPWFHRAASAFFVTGGAPLPG